MQHRREFRRLNLPTPAEKRRDQPIRSRVGRSGRTAVGEGNMTVILVLTLGVVTLGRVGRG